MEGRKEMACRARSPNGPNNTAFLEGAI